MNASESRLSSASPLPLEFEIRIELKNILIEQFKDKTKVITSK